MNGEPQAVRELYFFIKGEFKSTREDINNIGEMVREHKSSHWKYIAATISVCGVLAAVLAIFIK